MRKVLNGLLNVVAIITLLIALAGGVFLGLDPEIQAKIPLELREVIILIMTNGSFGAIVVIAKGVVAKNSEEANTKIATLTQLTLRLVDKIEKLEHDNTLREEQTNRMLNRNNELLEADLKIKKTNPLLKKELKEHLDKVGV